MVCGATQRRKEGRPSYTQTECPSRHRKHPLVAFEVYRIVRRRHMTTNGESTTECATPVLELQGDVLEVVAMHLGRLSIQQVPVRYTRCYESFQWAQTRTLCTAFRDAIDKAACLEMTTRPERHFTSNGVKHVERTTPSFVAFAFMRAYTCVLCKLPFTGCVSDAGVYAHPECVKRNALSTIYLKKPLTCRAVERMDETDDRLEAAVSQSADGAFSRLSTTACSGYNRYVGTYDYEMALVGPSVPMLVRHQTILGAACPTDTHLREVVVAHAVRTTVERLIMSMESTERKRKANDLQGRRAAASAKRQRRFRDAASTNTYTNTLDAVRDAATKLEIPEKDVVGTFAHDVLTSSVSTTRVVEAARFLDVAVARVHALVDTHADTSDDRRHVTDAAWACVGCELDGKLPGKEGPFQFALDDVVERVARGNAERAALAAKEAVEAERRARQAAAQAERRARVCSTPECGNLHRVSNPATGPNGPVCGGCERRR